MKASIVQNLAEEVLLGRDVLLHKHMVRWLPRSEQMDLLRQLAKDNEVQLATESENMESALAGMTRVQKRRAQQQKIPMDSKITNPEQTQENTIASQNLQGETDLTAEHVSSTQDEDSRESQELPAEESTVSGDFQAGEEFQFLEELFETLTRTKTRLTRAEKRRNCQRWTSTNIATATQVKNEQESDPDIQKWLKQEDLSRVKPVKGVLCRLWRPRNLPGETYEQIVLPKRYHQQVMKIAHDLPFAGHLGREKTALRILR